MESLWVLVLIAAFTASPAGAVYCRSNTCTTKGKQHVLCSYPNDMTSYNCSNVISRGLKDWEKQVIVDTHNQLRARVAQGFEKQGNPGPQPGASNMRIMSWDRELATIAQRWVDQCDFRLAPCVDVERFEVSQNYVMNFNDRGEVATNVTNLINYMYSHVKFFDKRRVSKHQPDRRTYLYTNLIWANSYKIGCGALSFGTDLKKFTFYCLYGPGGGTPDVPVYEALQED